MNYSRAWAYLNTNGKDGGSPYLCVDVLHKLQNIYGNENVSVTKVRFNGTFPVYIKFVVLNNEIQLYASEEGGIGECIFYAQCGNYRIRFNASCMIDMPDYFEDIIAGHTVGKIKLESIMTNWLVQWPSNTNPNETNGPKICEEYASKLAGKPLKLGDYGTEYFISESIIVDNICQVVAANQIVF